MRRRSRRPALISRATGYTRGPAGQHWGRPVGPSACGVSVERAPATARAVGWPMCRREPVRGSRDSVSTVRDMQGRHGRHVVHKAGHKGAPRIPVRRGASYIILAAKFPFVDRHGQLSFAWGARATGPWSQYIGTSECRTHTCGWGTSASRTVRPAARALERNGDGWLQVDLPAEMLPICACLIARVQWETFTNCLATFC